MRSRCRLLPRAVYTAAPSQFPIANQPLVLEVLATLRMRNRNSGTRVVPGEAGAKAQGAAGRAGHCPAPGRGAGVHRGPRLPGSHYSVRGKGGFCFCCREPVAPSSPASRGERLEFRVLLRQLGVADGRVIQVAESQPYQMRTAPASARGGVMKRVWSNVTARAQRTRALSPHRASRARRCFAEVPLHHPPAPREAGRSCRPHFTDTELRHIRVTSGMPRATQGLQLGPDPTGWPEGPRSAPAPQPLRGQPHRAGSRADTGGRTEGDTGHTRPRADTDGEGVSGGSQRETRLGAAPLEKGAPRLPCRAPQRSHAIFAKLAAAERPGDNHRASEDHTPGQQGRTGCEENRGPRASASGTACPPGWPGARQGQRVGTGRAGRRPRGLLRGNGMTAGPAEQEPEEVGTARAGCGRPSLESGCRNQAGGRQAGGFRARPSGRTQVTARAAA